MTNAQIFEMASRAGLFGANPDINNPLIARALPELKQYTEMATAPYIEALLRTHAVMKMLERASIDHAEELADARKAISRCIGS